jgi:hypothetical protein
MKRYVLPLLICGCLLTACELDYEDNARLLFTGVVVDENNQPLSNVPVVVQFNDRTSIFGGFNSEVLGEKRTDENGNYSIVSLSPKGNKDFSIHINESKQNGYKLQYASYSILGIETIVDSDNKYELPDFKIERVINSKLELNRVNSNDTLFYKVLYQWREKLLNLDSNSVLPIDDPIDFFSPSDTILPSQTQKMNMISEILANTPVQILYRLGGDSSSEVLIENTNADTQTNSYVFEF